MKLRQSQKTGHYYLNLSSRSIISSLNRIYFRLCQIEFSKSCGGSWGRLADLQGCRRVDQIIDTRCGRVNDIETWTRDNTDQHKRRKLNKLTPEAILDHLSGSCWWGGWVEDTAAAGVAVTVESSMSCWTVRNGSYRVNIPNCPISSISKCINRISWKYMQ